MVALANPKEIVVIVSLKQDRTLAEHVSSVLESSDYICIHEEISNTISSQSLESLLLHFQPVFSIILICSRYFKDKYSGVLDHLSNDNVNKVLLVSNDRENISFSTPPCLTTIDVSAKEISTPLHKEVERSGRDALQSKFRTGIAVGPKTVIEKEELHNINLHSSTQRNNSLQLPEQDLSGNEFPNEHRLTDEVDELRKDISKGHGEEEAVWDLCFKEGKIYIRNLLKKGRYPPADILDELCDCYGRKSRIICALCKSAKRKIKTNIENTFDTQVVDIYPSFKESAENKIIFVVTLNNRVNKAEIFELISYAVKIKILNAYNKEPTLLAQHILKEKIFMKQEELRNVQSYQERIEEDLFGKHKYLSIIAPAPVKSFQYSESDQHLNVERKVCLQLYVHVKGFIPIWEDPFEKQYGGIDTDVIECVFVSFGKTAREPHDNLKMGCEIQRESITDLPTKGGTLGGFIEHPELGLCGITCAHAMLYRNEFEKCVQNNNKLTLQEWPLDFKQKTAVYQPNKESHSTAIGTLSEAYYDKGNKSKSGYDVALIKICNRHPVDGTFPLDGQQGKPRVVSEVYESGAIADYTTFATDLNVEVWKFGSTSDSTNGFLLSGTVTAREIDFGCFNDDTYSLKLHKQIRVTSRGLTRFVKEGDSGAFVFHKHDGQLACIGMLEGGFNDNYGLAVVAPIKPILERLKVQNNYTFSDTKLYKMEARLERNFSEILNGIYSQLQRMQGFRQDEVDNTTT